MLGDGSCSLPVREGGRRPAFGTHDKRLRASWDKIEETMRVGRRLEHKNIHIRFGLRFSRTMWPLTKPSNLARTTSVT